MKQLMYYHVAWNAGKKLIKPLSKEKKPVRISWHAPLADLGKMGECVR
jgi:hypothetical protein